MDEPRRSNARDAELVAMPMCPRCHSANGPGQKPVIELIGRVYFCNARALEFQAPAA